MCTSTSAEPLQELHEPVSTAAVCPLVSQTSNHLDDAAKIKSSSAPVLAVLAGRRLGGVDDPHDPVEECGVQASLLGMLQQRVTAGGLDHGDDILDTELLFS